MWELRPFSSSGPRDRAPPSAPSPTAATWTSSRTSPWTWTPRAGTVQKSMIFCQKLKHYLLPRYLFLNCIANQLRYPNSHTHYFSCCLLYLFAEANTEAIQEQITRWV